MSHLWQRFLLASSLVVGLAIGVAATVFGYSNLRTVDVHWAVFQLNGVPLWTVAVIPITLLLIAGTLYHWLDGLHHFSEHMRHRHRVHELEAEVARLRAHLDQVLEMPRSEVLATNKSATPSLPPAAAADLDREMASVEDGAQPVPAAPAGDVPAAPAAADSEPMPVVLKVSGDRKKRARLLLDQKPADTAPEHTNGVETEPAAPAQEA